MALAALLGDAVFVPGLTRAGWSRWGFPEWLGATTSMFALAAALIVFWRAGALRLRYLGLLAVAIALAALVGAL